MDTQLLSQDPLIGPEEVATYLGVPRAFVGQMRRDGRLPRPMKFGRKVYRWHRSTIVEWAKQAANAPQPA